MKKKVNLVSLFLIIPALLVGSISNAGVVTPFIRSTQEGILELNLDYIGACHVLYLEQEYKFIPEKIKSTDTSTKMTQKILDHNFKNYLNYISSPGLINTVESVSQGVKSNISTHQDHKLSFNIKALEAKTELNYSGVVDAKLSLRVDSGKLDLEISRKLAHKTQLVFNHNSHSDFKTDILSLRYSF